MDGFEQPNLPAHRHHVVGHRDDDRRGHVDVADPVLRRVRADGPTCLEHHPPVVHARLLDRPGLPQLGLALQVDLLRQPPSGLQRREPGDGGQTRQTEEAQLLLTRRGEVRGRGAQDQSHDAVRVAAPDQLGHRATHRITDGDEPFDAERIAQRDGIVGTVLEPERLSRPDATAVAAVVDRDHPEMAGERFVGGEPVEVCRCGPAVQQQQCRRAWWAVETAHERGASARQLDLLAEGQCGRRHAATVGDGH